MKPCSLPVWLIISQAFSILPLFKTSMNINDSNNAVKKNLETLEKFHLLQTGYMFVMRSSTDQA